VQGDMIKDHLRAVLQRVANWPEDRQEELAELALAIEAEMSGSPYQASGEELEAIDAALSGETASKEEINLTYANFSRHEAGVRKKSPRRFK
jgi:hypothetical protein